MKILIATDGSHFSEVAIEKFADILEMEEGTEIKIVLHIRILENQDADNRRGGG